MFLFEELIIKIECTKEPYTSTFKNDNVPYSLSVPRPVPLPLRKSLKFQLNKICAQGIIEPAHAPTN